jgi:hypothetical protein
MTMAEAWLTELNVQDIEITSDSLNAAQSKLRRAHPEQDAMWFELMDLADDLHKSWEIVWAVEHGRTPFSG